MQKALTSCAGYNVGLLEQLIAFCRVGSADFDALQIPLELFSETKVPALHRLVHGPWGLLRLIYLVEELGCSTEVTDGQGRNVLA